MKVCVVGAGGVGGLLAAVLRRAGVDVSLLVTERHLTPIRQNGLAVIGPDGRFSVEIQAETDPRAIGACDVVIVTVKMWALEALAPTLRPLLRENTAVIPMQNGIDAPEVLAKTLGWEHVVYGSISMNAAIEAPGVIRQKNPNSSIAVAEKQGGVSSRLAKVKEIFGAAGITVEVGADGPTLACLQRYAQAIGLAFQVVDDILDVTADSATLGKTAGKDQANDKPTFVSLLGLAGAQAQAQALLQDALAALDAAVLSDDGALRALAHMVVQRDR